MQFHTSKPSTAANLLIAHSQTSQLSGTKRPDPCRLTTLMEYPSTQNKSQLQRLLGFFAYNAEWVADYSNRVRPL